MKIVPSNDNSKTSSKIILPLIDDPEVDKLDKTNSVSYELRSTPGDADSPKYKTLVRVLLGTESPRAVIKWRKDCSKVVRGLNITTLEPMMAIVETMMAAGPASTFTSALNIMAGTAYRAARDAAAPGVDRDAVIANGPDHYRTVPMVLTSLNAVVASLLPNKVLARVKRNLRREMRKPVDMKVRHYFNNINRINQEEIVHLPPFLGNQSLLDDEMIDILLFSTPKSWSREMDRQGFDPMTKTLPDVVDFLEQIESAEDFDGQKVEASKKKSSGSTKSKDKKSGGSKYCMVHGHCGHSSEDCTVLQREAKKLKNNGSASSSTNKSNGNGGNYGNKTWSRNAIEASSQSKKDLKALVKRQVKMTVKELKAADKKKRKSSGDDSSLEANALELNDFNYTDMSNLSLSDNENSDEVSV